MRNRILLSIVAICAFCTQVHAADKEPNLRIELLSPNLRMPAQRLQHVTFRSRVQFEDLPIMVVRSAEPNSPWWVQDRLKKTLDGRLSGTAWIGNATTPTGSKFFVRLVVPKDKEVLKSLRRGSTIQDLDEYWSSKSFELTAGPRGAPDDDAIAGR